jgi:hypothetical protein
VLILVVDSDPMQTIYSCLGISSYTATTRREQESETMTDNPSDRREIVCGFDPEVVVGLTPGAKVGKIAAIADPRPTTK